MKLQPLKDKSCWVPCTGLYADVAADYKQDTEALEKNMIKGNLNFREDQRLKKYMGIAHIEKDPPTLCQGVIFVTHLCQFGENSSNQLFQLRRLF